VDELHGKTEALVSSRNGQGSTFNAYSESLCKGVQAGTWQKLASVGRA
jgi:hypothetical protein